MTEFNLFCYSERFNNAASFQQERYRAFNKFVGKERYNELKAIIEKIIGQDNTEDLPSFWESITQNQWKELLSIPEAKDFKEGFYFISEYRINTKDTVEIRVNGNIKRISYESAKELNLI